MHTSSAEKFRSEFKFPQAAAEGAVHAPKRATQAYVEESLKIRAMGHFWEEFRIF
jgi:hypothetical protein